MSLPQICEKFGLKTQASLLWKSTSSDSYSPNSADLQVVSFSSPFTPVVLEGGVRVNIGDEFLENVAVCLEHLLCQTLC